MFCLGRRDRKICLPSPVVRVLKLMYAYYPSPHEQPRKRATHFQEAPSCVLVEVLGRREKDAPDGGNGGNPLHGTGQNYWAAHGDGNTDQKCMGQGGDHQWRFRRFSEVKQPQKSQQKKISGHNVPSAFPDIITLIIMAMHVSKNTFRPSTAQKNYSLWLQTSTTTTNGWSEFKPWIYEYRVKRRDIAIWFRNHVESAFLWRIFEF